MKLRTCVSAEGSFLFCIHKPHFHVENLRETDAITSLGKDSTGKDVFNTANFPEHDIEEPQADWIFEVPNAFPFRGTTYIGKNWADASADDPARIRIPSPGQVSLSQCLDKLFTEDQRAQAHKDRLFAALPEPLLLALAVNSTDAGDLVRLAEISCEFVRDPITGKPLGMVFSKDQCGRLKPKITNPHLFEAVANNAYLPDEYKEVMVLRPGAQGNSEIVGEWKSADGTSHVYEYLRRNSYIPWGHYAANMANTCIRYHLDDLTADDIYGMRHLYYQRTYVRMASHFNIEIPVIREQLSVNQLESLRQNIGNHLADKAQSLPVPFDATLWGWNFGFDYAPSKYRLHASHQQVHQQYALIPTKMAIVKEKESDLFISSYACGDLIAEFIRQYHSQTGEDFFSNYVKAIQSNQRMDGRQDRESSLVIYSDDRVMVFVPKAQTSQWELQIMPLAPVGNILEADTLCRQSLDHAILIAIKVLGKLGARMVTSIEYSKRFVHGTTGQRLLYALLPRLPESPGAFSEAQYRWINGHYPEDFAAACRNCLADVSAELAGFHPSTEK